MRWKRWRRCAAAAEAATDADDRVVRAKMERTCEVIMACGRVVSARAPKSMRHVAKLLARCASSADASGGSEKFGKRAFQATLNLTVDGRPKVRKAAVYALSDVMRRMQERTGDARGLGETYGEMTAAFARKSERHRKAPPRKWKRREARRVRRMLARVRLRQPRRRCTCSAR